MYKVRIRHQSGSKNRQIETFAFEGYSEVVLGRDPECLLRYDDIQDETVSGKHAKITRDPSSAERFAIEDLRSRNGTFVDGKMIDRPVPLAHGCRVQLGLTGPAFIFETDPPPSRKATVADPGGGSGAQDKWWERPAITRMRTRVDNVNSSFQRPGALLASVATLLLVVVLVGVYLHYFRRVHSGASILDANRQSMVSIESTWSVFDSNTGRRAFQWYVRNPYEGDGAVAEALRGKERVAVFVKMPDGLIEPVLMLDDEKGTNHMIGGRITGAGCVVNVSGYILTSSRVSSPWTSGYTLPSDAMPGLLVDLGNKSISLIKEAPQGWVPISARFVMVHGTSLENFRAGKAQPVNCALEGRLDSLSVAFSGSDHRVTANLSGISVRSSIAMIKIDLPQSLRAVQINREDTPIAVADPVYVAGFDGPPNASRELEMRVAGVVSIEGSSATGKASASCPGCYELSDSGAEAGYVGGPVFDDRGRVIGIFESSEAPTSKIDRAVPIHFAFKMLGFDQR
jgi:serine protease Do